MSIATAIKVLRLHTEFVMKEELISKAAFFFENNPDETKVFVIEENGHCYKERDERTAKEIAKRKGEKVLSVNKDDLSKLKAAAEKKAKAETAKAEAETAKAEAAKKKAAEAAKAKAAKVETKSEAE